MKQQRGGTILGLIMGVVLGLGAALGVAIYVTKVPILFLNKAQSRTTDQDVAETKKNKDWDPNTPLHGKNPAKPAAPASVAVAEVRDAPVPVPLVPATAPATAPAPVPAKVAVAVAVAAKSAPVAGPAVAIKPEVRPAVSADPLGDLAKAKSNAAGAELFTYFVQAGAFRTPEDAEGQRAKLSLTGIEAKVTEREQSGRAVFRVRVGPFDKKDEADKIKNKLDATGMETALVRVQR